MGALPAAAEHAAHRLTPSQPAPVWCGGSEWRIEELRGTAADLLQAPAPGSEVPRLARVHVVERPALVLGSTQRLDIVDHERAEGRGVEVVRRRSGGGAVLLVPQRQLWVDLFLRSDDPLWSDDVSEAALWVGELWAAAAAAFTDRPISIHTGRLVADRWGRLVCFAGTGPGEVLVGGRKVVGVSQRRSRDRCRIQTTARLAGASGDSADELELLRLTDAERDAGRAVIADRCSAIPAAHDDLLRAVRESLT